MIWPLWTIATSAKPVAQNGWPASGETSDSVARRTWPMPCVPVKRGDVVDVVDVVGAADVLDDVEALADRGDLGDVLHRVGEGLQVAVEGDREAGGGADALLLDDRGVELGELGLDARDRPVGLVALADEEAQPQVPSPFGLVVEGEAGRVGAAVLAAVEHRDQRLADLAVVAVLLVEDPGDPAHVFEPRPSWWRLPTPACSTPRIGP